MEYLKSRGLIDYSLLLAVEVSVEKFEPEKLVEKRIKYDIVTRKKIMNVLNSQVNVSRQR